LVKIFSNSLLPKDISPYQTNGDIKSEESFFGRVEILREIISNSKTNYFVVGARQMGKSSILKALERRYRKNGTVCYYATLDERGNIIEAIAESLGLDASVTLDDIVEKIKTDNNKPIFLIDEVDMFVAKEAENGYLITSVLRKLTQEDRATFVFSGFWTLYKHITSEYHAPLRNFGKVKILEGLEEDASRDLMIKPMSKIGIEYKDKSIVDRAVKLCGYRANYISILCDEMLKVINKNIIDESALEKALDSNMISQMLQGWGTLSDDDMTNRLDRLIVYITVKEDSFRLSYVVDNLKELGLEIDIQLIKESLDRLVLGYVLNRTKANYSYQIPLLKEFLMEDDLEYMRDGEVFVLKKRFGI